MKNYEKFYLIRCLSVGGKLKVESREFTKEEYENSYSPQHGERFLDILDEEYESEEKALEAITKDGVIGKEYIILPTIRKVR